MESAKSAALAESRPSGQDRTWIQRRRALVVLNPVAGRSTREDVLAVLEQTLGAAGWEYAIHELEKDEPPERLDDRLKQAAGDEVPVIIASGGDGTVSYVADAMLRTELTDELFLGILPGGTANLLAGELGIPDDLTAAAGLIAGEFSCTTIDAMRIGDKHYFLRVGVGLDAITIRDTTREAKRWFGKLAYGATLLKALGASGTHRFAIQVDGRPRFVVRATQATVANGGFIGMKPLRLGPDITPTDRRLNLCLYAVRHWTDFFKVLWRLVARRYDEQANMRFYEISRQVTIQTRTALPVQADGEPIGETPVTVEVVPGAIRIVRPCGPEIEH